MLRFHHTTKGYYWSLNGRRHGPFINRSELMYHMTYHADTDQLVRLPAALNYWAQA